MRAVQAAFQRLLLSPSLTTRPQTCSAVSALAMPRSRRQSGTRTSAAASGLQGPAATTPGRTRGAAVAAVAAAEAAVVVADASAEVTVAQAAPAKPARRKHAGEKAAEEGQEADAAASTAGSAAEQQEAAAAPPKKRRRASKAAAAASAADALPQAAAAEGGADAAPAGKAKKPARARKRAKQAKGAEEAAEKLEFVALPSACPPGKLVGAHVSMASGIERAVVNAASIGAKAFALDTRSKRRWDCPPLADTNVAAFRAACVKFGFSPRQILPHGSYLINLGSPVPETLEKSYAAFVSELQSCAALGIALYNIHPGSTNKLCTPEECMRRVADCINRAHAETSGVTVVLENVAGMGGSVGRSFEELAFMIEHVEDKARVGVCLDTCHMFAAGYDVSTRQGYQDTMAKFGEVVGFDKLKGMHVNDSKCALGSRRDRHANIGRGLIGMACFECLMADPRLDGIPLIMETPVQEKGPSVDYKKSLAAGEVVLRQGKNDDPDCPECTDTRDIRLLYSLCT